jgi:hypothetical protein
VIPDELGGAVRARLHARFDPEPASVERLALEVESIVVRPRRWTSSLGVAHLAVAASVVIATVGMALVLANWDRTGEVGSAGPVVGSPSASNNVPTQGSVAPTPDLPTALPSLGDALLVVGYSDEYLMQAERTVEVPAGLVVWDSGLVVGNPLYEGFRAVQLSPAELEDLRQELLAADLTTLSLPNQEVASDRVYCRDCSVSIIRTDVSGDTVEVAVWALVPELGPDREGWQTLPANVVRVGHLIEELWIRIRADSATPWAGDVPSLPISRPPIGG